jgi:redox-regulated HSP33 family molecular chaperone
MQVKKVVVVLGLFLLATAILGAQALKLDGTWEGKVDHEGRLETMTFQFHVSGKVLSGKVLREGDDFGTFSDGKVDGKTISFNVSGVSFAGEMDGEQLKITITVTNGNKFNLNASRKKS